MGSRFRRFMACLTAAAIGAVCHASAAWGAVEIFSNPTPITIPDGGAATAYPSTIPVAITPNSSYTGIEVSFNGVTSGAAQHLVFLVQAANGSTFVPIAHIGATQTGQTWTVGNTAATASCGVPTPTSTFQPKQCPPEPSWPSPAPPPPYGGLGSVDYGNPNGTWKLFVRDDTAGGGSSTLTGGWTLRLTTYAFPPPWDGGGGGDDGVVNSRKCGKAGGKVQTPKRVFRVRGTGLSTFEVLPNHPLTCKRARAAFVGWVEHCLPLRGEGCALKGSGVPKSARRVRCEIEFSATKPVSRARDTITCRPPEAFTQGSLRNYLFARWIVRRAQIPFAAGYQKRAK